MTNKYQKARDKKFRKWLMIIIGYRKRKEDNTNRLNALLRYQRFLGLFYLILVITLFDRCYLVSGR